MEYVKTIKSIEVEGTKIELTSNGSVFNLNVTNEYGYRTSRAFTDYSEASKTFDTYLRGN